MILYMYDKAVDKTMETYEYSDRCILCRSKETKTQKTVQIGGITNHCWSNNFRVGYLVQCSLYEAVGCRPYPINQ